MVRPAQLYKEELNKKMIDCWYDEKYMFYSGWTGDNLPKIPDDCYESHHFVSVDKNDNVIGYVSYHINWSTMSADHFGAISFDIGSVLFGKDLYLIIKNLFRKHNMNRIQWSVIVGNPAYKSYKSFVKKHGGRECAYYRQSTKLMDGELHDSAAFEILSSEFKE